MTSSGAGTRLVLVLEEPVRAESRGPQARRRERLNSTTYAKSDALEQQMGIHARFFAPPRKTPESVIQDWTSPSPAHRVPRILPRGSRSPAVWICPIGGYHDQAKFPLYAVDPKILYVNFGFWDVVEDTVKREPGHYNRKIERKVAELGGVKSLYSDSYYPEEEFWRLYDQGRVRRAEGTLRPEGAFKNLLREVACCGGELRIWSERSSLACRAARSVSATSGRSSAGAGAPVGR